MRFITLDAETFRKFAEKSPYKSFTQTPEIANLRETSGWTAYYFGVEEGRELKAAAMLVARPTFLGKSTFYCPGGPLLDYEDACLTTFFFKHLKAYIKSHNGYVLHIDPYYELIQRNRDGQPVEHGFNHQTALQNLKNLGFTKAASTQPQFLFTLDLKGRTPDQLFADLKRNTRNHVRKAEKMGVKIRELKREELGIFKQITESTSLRRHFTDRPLSYYEEMYDLFHKRGEVKFLLAEANIAATKTPEPDSTISQQSESNISQHLRGTDSQNHNVSGSSTELSIPAQSRRTRCDFNDREPSTLRNVGLDCLTPMSAAMFILYGSEVIYLYSGSDEKYMKDYNAQYLIQWHMIKYAAEHKFKTYNFYGINGLPDKSQKDYGIYDFKKGFTSESTGRVIELIGSFELSTNATFYHLHRLLSRLKHRH